MAKEREKLGPIERFSGFMERLNYAIGAVALTGSVILESQVLAIFGVLQFAEGAVWKWLKDRKNKMQKHPNPQKGLAFAT